MLPLLLLLLQPALAGDPDIAWLPDAYSAGDRSAPSSTPFWHSFGEPDLDATVRRGLSANPDLLALDALSRQQRALSAQGFSPVLPSLSFDLQGQVAPYDSLGFGFGLGGLPSTGDEPDVYGTGSAKLNASLMVDIWGRSLTNWKASRLAAMAAEGDRDATALVMASSIAGVWLDVTSATRQLAIIEEQLGANQELLEIVRLRYEGGTASALDLLQQEQNVAALSAQLPLTRATVRNLQQMLAVLQGMDPTGDLPTAGDRLPALPAPPSIGSPVDLLETRPDVRAAMDRAEAAGASRSVALRGLLPTLALSASAGWQATWINERSDQDTWAAGASLSVPIFNGGATHASIRAGTAAQEASERQLESTLRSAVQEVEGALVSETEQGERLAATTRQRDRAEAAWSVALDGYGAGLADYTQVQLALTTLLSARLAEVQAHRDLLGARLSLHQALGGTWTHDLTAAGAR